MPTIRRGAADDLPAIAAIQAASPQAAQWNVADYLAYHLYVAIFNDAVAGFLVARSLGFGEGELLNLAVTQDARRNGLGRALMAALLSDFPEGVYLEVRESNTAAQNLYKSLGFNVVSKRNGYYSEPLETAIVMKFHSC